MQKKTVVFFSVLITDHCLYLALIINGYAISSILTIERKKKNQPIFSSTLVYISKIEAETCCIYIDRDDPIYIERLIPYIQIEIDPIYRERLIPYIQRLIPFGIILLFFPLSYRKHKQTSGNTLQFCGLSSSINPLKTVYF